MTNVLSVDKLVELAERFRNVRLKTLSGGRVFRVRPSRSSGIRFDLPSGRYYPISRHRLEEYLATINKKTVGQQLRPSDFPGRLRERSYVAAMVMKAFDEGFARRERFEMAKGRSSVRSEPKFRRQRLLFVRTGWMKYYAGPQPGDERPLRGGRYNEDHIGHEAWNFLPADERVYGYYETGQRGEAGSTDLRRIDPAAATDFVDGVTVVFVATRAAGGQVIVGWYRNARVFRACRKPAPRLSRPISFLGYRCLADSGDATLLPINRRRFLVPKRGGMGRVNVCYPFELNGDAKGSLWIGKAAKFIEEYDGPNWAELEETLEIEAIEASSSGAGQGRLLSAKDRKALELHGMERAKLYFLKRGYRNVKDVSRVRPSVHYDLHFTRSDGKELWVEVKATTQSGAAVLLTHGEATHASLNGAKMALYVLHSVHLKDGVASRGEEFAAWPWKFDWNDAKPNSYRYSIGGR